MDDERKAELIRQIDSWNENDEFTKCIQAIESIPKAELDYQLVIKLARAYSNLAVLGDHNSREEVNEGLLWHAINLLYSIRDTGENDPYWNSRMAYAYIMANNSSSTAYKYACRWLELAPDDTDAKKLVMDCEQYMKDEEALDTDMREIRDIIRKETPDDDILGHVRLHIDKYFGTYTESIIDDSDNPLEVAIIPPRLEHDYYTLVTIGMSRYRMHFPEERREEKLERAELLINLPADWELTHDGILEEKWKWPLRMLLITAQFPMKNAEVGLEAKATLMDGEEGVPLSEDTALCGGILLWPGVFGEESFACHLPDGDDVNFYQLIPLYKEEVQYKLKHGADALLDLCPDESLEVIDPHRLNVVTDKDKIGYDLAEMDNADIHLEKIRTLNLPVEDLAAYNLMAFYLGWAMKRNQMSNPFLSKYKSIVEAVQTGDAPDLRMFIRDNLGGKLSTQFFDRKGSGFAQWYAQDNRSNPYVYRRDCRNIVLEGMHYRTWGSLKEKEAAYLLLPYTDNNRNSIEQLLDKRFMEYLEKEFEDNPEERVANIPEAKPPVIPDWDGPLFCYASDRVAQDGCQICLMYRVLPDREDMGWESGWAFYSGDEGNVYGENDEYFETHCGYYDIRDICRITPDIVPYLGFPYGTSLMRGNDGIWYETADEDEDPEETE